MTWQTPPGPGSRQSKFRFVSNDWAYDVATTRDTALRTHRITLTYAKFGGYLDRHIFHKPPPRRRVLSGDPKPTPEAPPDGASSAASNANWFQFATWGTYTLGPNIRNDSGPQRLESLPQSIRRWVTPTILHTRAEDGDIVGRALSWGQLLIFLSAAKALIHFDCIKDELLTPGAKFETPEKDRDELLKVVNSSETSWIDKGHVEIIDRAFSAYALARRHARTLQPAAPASDQPAHDNDPSSNHVVCRLVLYGTILLTIVEQDLVTGALKAMADSVPLHFINQVDAWLASTISKRRAIPRQVVALNLLDQLSQASQWMTDTWARFLTKEMLVIVLPAETLRLGRDIPPRDLTAPLYPRCLDQLAFQDADVDQVVDGDKDLATEYLKGLDTLVKSLDRTASGGLGSAGRDWRRFDDRLNWAICLFRSRQQDGSLFWPAYSVEDEHRIVDGQLPRGRSLGSVIPPLDGDAIAKVLNIEETIRESEI